MGFFIMKRREAEELRMVIFFKFQSSLPKYNPHSSAPPLLCVSIKRPSSAPLILCVSTKRTSSAPPLLSVSNKYLLQRSALNKVSVSECYKPDFVPVPRSGAVDVHLSRPPERPPRRSGVRHTRNRWTGRPIPYFALHRNGFILPPLLPPER